jgi:hypothetical protein
MYRLLIILFLILPLTVVAKQLRDPTQPPNFSSTESVSGGLRIDGIFIGAHSKNVIINGLTLKEGDSIQGANITAIYPHEIRLKDSTGEFTIKMVNVVNKTQVKNLQKDQQNETTSK